MRVYSSALVPVVPVEEAEGVSVQWLVNREHGAPNFAMRLFQVQPGKATPLHTHGWEHEVYVLEGEGVVRGSEGEVPIVAGDVAFVAPGDLHQFANTGQAPMRFICVVPHQ